jgi:hypothetical protein
MKKHTIRLIALTLALSGFLYEAAWAGSTFPAQTPSLNRKARNLGMGNVGVAIPGTHDSAAFYNPAGLNDLEKGEFRFLTINTEIGFNAFELAGDTIDFGQDIDDAADDQERVQVLNQFIQERTGEFQYFRLGMELVNYTRKNFAAGLLFDQRLNASFRNQGYPNFDLRSIGDIAGYVALAQGFYDGGLQVGMTFKPTARFSLRESDQQITYGDVTVENAEGDPILIDQLKDIYQEWQFRIPVDFGLKSKLSGFIDNAFVEKFEPMVGFTWQDVGNMNFNPLPGNRQTFNVGASLNPQLGRFKNTWAVELREINIDRPIISKLHIGAEIQLPAILAIRGGLSQGYLTGGATIDLRFFSLDGAIYFEEVGRNTRQDGDLRFATTMSFKI